MDRRGFLASAAVASVAAPLIARQPSTATAAPGSVDPLAGGYRSVVSEIFRPPRAAAAHSEAIVIGSGFGASATALRLAQAGVGVTMLERGSRWPIDAWRPIHCSDLVPDGRGLWHRTSFTQVTGTQMPVDDFGGVLDITDYPGISVWRAAAVGGGSVVFTGVMIEPEKRFFSHVFGRSLDYGEMHNVFYPRVRSMLRLSPMPDDVYNSATFTHSRVWDQHVRKAGYTPRRVDGIWNWGVVRRELAGRSRRSATVGESNYGNSNGAKFDLRQNYLKIAEATGRLSVHPGHKVSSIGREADGRYRVSVSVIAPTGDILTTRTLTADRLFLGAGSVGSSELLVKARATGALPRLNEHIGRGWGSNGDAVLVRGPQTQLGGMQASPSATRILDESGMPLSLENWFVPGGTDTGLIASLGMTLDSSRASFRYVPSSGRVTLDWPRSASNDTVAALHRTHSRIADAAGVGVGVGPLFPEVSTAFTAHPLGGAVLGKATDGYGRVRGYDGLYVVDGALIPGSTGTVNPSLTITALAERNIEQIIRSGK